MIDAARGHGPHNATGSPYWRQLSRILGRVDEQPIWALSARAANEAANEDVASVRQSATGQLDYCPARHSTAGPA